MVASRRPERTAEERLARVLGLQRVLGQVAREIGPAVDIQLVLKTVLGAMRSLVSFQGGTIQLRDETGVFVAAADPDVSGELRRSRVPVGRGLSGWVVQTSETVYSPDIRADPRADPDRVALNPSIRSYLAVPLVVMGDVVGALQIDAPEVDAFDEEDVALLEGLAVQVAGAIEGARRHEREAELERMKSDFIARISHELRTPLTIMGGFTDTLLLHGERLDAAQRNEVLTRVKASIGRLSALIEEILTVASFEAGMTQVKLEEVHVRGLLDQVRELSLDAARVHVGCRDDLYVVTDAVILRHILNLLVDNALKYAGSATLDAERDAAGLSIFVTDEGPGIPDEERDRVFQRFYRGNHTGAGMGLGLPIARTLGDRLGATVELEASEGGGARFTVRFA